jgi:hypothetical protein
MRGQSAAGEEAMLATILFAVPIVVLPIVHVSQPTRDCRLEVLTPIATEERALVDFGSRIDAYVSLQRRLVRSIGATAMPDEEGEFFGDELRAVLIAARPRARQGSFFTPGIASVLRSRIDRGLLLSVPAIAGRLDEPLPGEPAPAVNGAFPFGSSAVTTWPALFGELPDLPVELGYAVWGRDLLLVDTVANLVLDVLPEALPEGAYQGVVYQ